MNRCALSWGIGILVTAIFTGSVFASPASTAQSGWRRKSNPYSDLFQPSPLVKPSEHTQVTQPSASAKPKVVCGMTVIPADPGIDPKFIVPLPDRPTRYTMRLIEPPICKP